MTDHDTPPVLADVRAELAAQWDRVRPPDLDPAAPPLVERLDGAPAPPGYTVWRIGGPGGPVTALPALIESAPLNVRRRYHARVVANGIGRCLLCSAVACIYPDRPDSTAWRVLPVTIGIDHAHGCPAEFTDADRQWFDPRALGPTRGSEPNDPA